MTPLHLSARFNNSAEVVRALIEAGADVNALNSRQRSPLLLASSCNPTIVTDLLEAKAKVNLLDKYQWSPLFWAARQEHKTAVAALMAAGADPQLGVSPLYSQTIYEDMKAFILSLEPLSSLQKDFTHLYAGTNFIFTDTLLLHKLLATGLGEQVLKRKDELNRDLVSRTCNMTERGNWMRTYSKVRCRVRLIS